MLLHDIWDFFEKRVFPVESTEILFNQYRDTDSNVDKPGADKIRRKNLKNYINSLKIKPTVLLVGEAAGPWGMRFSGIPFTGEAQLTLNLLPFKGKQSSNSLSPYWEYSGRIFWKVLLPYYENFFLWNLIPYHPHKRDDILSIRNPTKSEVKTFSPYLKEIQSILKPNLNVAIGRKAELALNLIESPCVYVRHPSQAGAGDFKKGIEKIFEKL